MSNLFDPWNKPVIGPQPEEDMFSGLDPRVAEHMRNKQLAEQGMERANSISALSGIGESAINAMTNKPAIYENRMQDLGNAPKVSQGQGVKLDTTGLREAAAKKLDAARHDAGDAVKVAFEQRKAELAKQVADSQAAKEDGWKQKEFNYKTQNDEANRKLKMQEMAQAKELAQIAAGAKQAEKEASKLEPKANQSTAANYGKRLLQAEMEMKRVGEETGYDRSDISSGVGSNMFNVFRSDAAVSNDQAEKNFINAVLRRESGAAISTSEFDNAEAQYFPRVGDGAETIAQKARNRAQVLESFKAESGPAWDQIPEVGISGNNNKKTNVLNSADDLP